MTAVRVIALGQPVAGDDGAALALLNRLTPTLQDAPDVELMTAAEASRLMDLLCHDGPVWVIDAIVGADDPGQVLQLDLQQLSRLPSSSVSSHGLDVAQAIELCATLYPERVARDIRIVAICIEPPRQYREGLSTPVADAVQRYVPILATQLHQATQGVRNA